MKVPQGVCLLLLLLLLMCALLRYNSEHNKKYNNNNSIQNQRLIAIKMCKRQQSFEPDRKPEPAAEQKTGKIKSKT